MQELFNNYQSINLGERQLEKFLNGMLLKVNMEDGIYNIYSKKYIGLGIIKDNRLKRDIIEVN